MTPLRQRMIDDRKLRNFSIETERSYIHYIAQFSRYFNTSPEQLGPEAIREYQLYLIDERKMSASSVNCFTAAAPFLFTETLELPWSRNHFHRLRIPETLPVTLSPTEVAAFFQAIGMLRFGAVPIALLRSRLAHFRGCPTAPRRHRFGAHGDSRPAR